MDDALLIALRLSKSGYGRPDQILNMPADVVIGAIAYESFLQKYEAAFFELNKENS